MASPFACEPLVQAPGFPAPPPGGPPRGVLPRQGQNFSGPILRYTSTALPDGSSPECTKLCLLVPSCTGYEVGGMINMLVKLPQKTMNIYLSKRSVTGLE